MAIVKYEDVAAYVGDRLVFHTTNPERTPAEELLALQRDNLALALASALEIIGPISGSEGSPLDDEILRLKEVLKENS